MRNRALWSTISVLLGIAFLVISCGQKAAEPAPAPAPKPAPAPGVPVPAPTPAPAPGLPQAPPVAAVEKPKYGGTLNVIRPSMTEKVDVAVSPG